MSKKMVLVDGNSLMHRAFHALPLLDDGNGVYTNAVFGFLSMLFKVLKDEKPDYLAVAFDLHGPTFRHLQYDAYKAGRPPMAEELRPQFPLLKELLAAMHVALVSWESFEADDMLGTLSLACEQEGVDALLVTGDRDAFQLAGEHTSILYTRRGISDTLLITPEYLMNEYRLTPAQMIDLKGLMGDASDNIPGVPGVGEKTALKLLAEYGTLEDVLTRGAQEQKGKLRERLAQFADQARFSKQIATIERHAPIAFDEESMRIHDMADGVPGLRKYKLASLEARLMQLPAAMLGNSAPAAQKDAPAEEDIPWKEPVTIADEEALATFADRLDPGAGFALSLEEASCALKDGTQARIERGGDLLSAGITDEALCARLSGTIAGNGEKIVCDVKALRHMMDTDASIHGEVFDVKLAAYVLSPQRKSYALSSLLEDEGLSPDAGHTQAARIWQLRARQRAALEATGMLGVYRDMELPLSRTLYDMEKAGFLVDAKTLRELGAIYAQMIAGCQERVYALAGHSFNINSPKQLGDVLFGEMNLPGGKKTSRGYSTSADILEKLSEDHEIARAVLDYRKYFKLNSTYIEALLRLQGADGRIHTLFDQTSTATGRISSNEPNLQNIPVRTQEGRQIRRAFIAPEGSVLIDADYSQIELRVMAHLSEDPSLIDAFVRGEDIHRRTAAEVYGVPMEDVTGEMRSAAKAVNFGIIYGISQFGLSHNIGISLREASSFIERYFERYPLVKRYMDKQVALAATEGYVTTLFGRRRYIPELKSSNYNTRSFGERAAMNSPVQGTAADIIKLAMIRADEALKEAGLAARLILQVHDELIVEAPESEAERAAGILRAAMEGAANLKVPLKVDLNMGRDWHACKA